ncbi:MAG: hypothetical protein DRN83_02275 [Hadesarchaea archaeon]|nr:MAG: hypothetical protein DRN83_02275 [Hadesarchaea archaeon]
MAVVYLDIESSAKKADEGMVVAIGLLTDKEPEVRFASSPGEEREALGWLREKLKDCELLVTWYGSGFDIPFLVGRGLVQGVDLANLFKIKMLDLCEWSRAHLLLSSYKLSSVARFLGVGSSTDFHGGDVSTLFKLAARSDPEARKLIVDHCKEDLILLRRVHEKLKSYVERS